MLRGKVYAGGWELDMVAFITLVVGLPMLPPTMTTNLIAS